MSAKKPESLEVLLHRAVQASSLHIDGPLTDPRSYGVYRLPASAGATSYYRFGNHPVRRLELIREFGRCELVHLFLKRGDADAVARKLNAKSR